jgi:hypothetical protein
MTRQQFLETPVWLAASQAYGWTEATLDAIAANGREVTETMDAMPSRDERARARKLRQVRLPMLAAVGVAAADYDEFDRDTVGNMFTRPVTPRYSQKLADLLLIQNLSRDLL